VSGISSEEEEDEGQDEKHFFRNTFHELIEENKSLVKRTASVNEDF
jgi:hypothetical protein